MFGKSSAVLVLLWLLLASFFNQVEGNNPVSSNSSKVSLAVQAENENLASWSAYLCFFDMGKKISFVKQLGIEGIR